MNIYLHGQQCNCPKGGASWLLAVGVVSLCQVACKGMLVDGSCISRK